MKLILVRHGESAANVREVIGGQSHGELTERGRLQAHKAALRLADEKIDKVYVSDLKRVVDTAAEIIKYHPDAEVVYEPLIREQHYGVLEGAPHGSLSKAAREAGVPKEEYQPAGGESKNEVRARVGQFLDKISHEERGKTVLLVTHSGVIVSALLHLFNLADTEGSTLRPNNTAVTMIELDFSSKHRILTLNCVKHLVE